MSSHSYLMQYDPIHDNPTTHPDTFLMDHYLTPTAILVSS